MENFDIIWTEEIDWSEDKLTINEGEFQKYLLKIQKRNSIFSEELISEVKNIKNRVIEINSLLDWLLDINTFDRWELDVKDWSQQEKIAIDIIANKLNTILNDFLISEEWTYLSLQIELDKMVLSRDGNKKQLVNEIKSILKVAESKRKINRTETFAIISKRLENY